MHEMHSIQVERERETLDNIKAKVARIKANQRKFEPDLIAAKTHSEGNFEWKIIAHWNMRQFFIVAFSFFRNKNSLSCSI